MKTRKWTDEELTSAVVESVSIAGVLRLLGLRPVGGNYKSIKTHIERLNLSTGHFTGQSWNTGENFRPFHNAIPLEKILVENSTYTSTSYLKKRLIDEQLLVNKCLQCQITEWLGEPISLHLDHINGNNRDNRLENLRLLCPNCHSQTETYCGKKNKRV